MASSWIIIVSVSGLLVVTWGFELQGSFGIDTDVIDVRENHLNKNTDENPSTTSTPYLQTTECQTMTIHSRKYQQTYDETLIQVIATTKNPTRTLNYPLETIYIQPTKTKYNSLTTVYESSILKYSSMSTSYYSTSTSCQPPKTTDQPTPTTYQPTNTKKPTETYQPSSSTSNPTKTTYNPGKTTIQPTKSTYQPITTSSPTKTTFQPTSTCKPSTATIHPTKSTFQPTSTFQPLKTTYKSISTTHQPTKTYNPTTSYHPSPTIYQLTGPEDDLRKNYLYSEKTQNPLSYQSAVGTPNKGSFSLHFLTIIQTITSYLRYNCDVYNKQVTSGETLMLE